MRIIEQLSKYDENLTLNKVKALILEEQQKENQKEENEFQEIKNKFNNTYLKIINNDGLFGKTVEIYQIEEIIRRERTTDWTFVYYFKGNKISFSKQNINFINIKGNKTHWSFSKEELEKAENIIELEYNLYLKQYQKLEDELKNILENVS
jgi:hypothetical protein